MGLLRGLARVFVMQGGRQAEGLATRSQVLEQLDGCVAAQGEGAERVGAGGDRPSASSRMGASSPPWAQSYSVVRLRSSTVSDAWGPFQVPVTSVPSSQAAPWSGQQRDESAALNAVALLQQATVVDLSAPHALSAAALGTQLNLPLEDSVIHATARAYEATLWTHDADFEGLPHVRYRAVASRT